MEELHANFAFVTADTLDKLYGIVYFLAVLKVQSLKIVSKISKH